MYIYLTRQLDSQDHEIMLPVVRTNPLPKLLQFIPWGTWMCVMKASSSVNHEDFKTGPKWPLVDLPYKIANPSATLPCDLKCQTHPKDYRTNCVINLTLHSWPSDTESRRNSGGCLLESPVPQDWGMQRQEDELTVGHWEINQDRHKEKDRLLSPRGKRLWDSLKPLTCLPVMALGWPHSVRSPLSRPLATVSRYGWEISTHTVNFQMTCYLEFQFSSLYMLFFARAAILSVWLNRSNFILWKCLNNHRYTVYLLYNMCGRHNLCLILDVIFRGATVQVTHGTVRTSVFGPRFRYVFCE